MAALRARRAERALRGVRRGRLLDVGCGHYPYFLTRSDFARRHGVDREPGPDWTARPADGITLAVADIERTPDLPFRTGTFDAVTMLAVVEHISERALGPLLADIRRVLAPGGRLVITTPPPWSDPVLRVLARAGLASSTELEEHQVTYTPSRLRGLLEAAGFSRVRAGVFEAGLNVWASGDAATDADPPRRSLWRLLPTLLVIAGAAAVYLRERETFADAWTLIAGSWSTLWIASFAALILGRTVLAGTSFVLASRRLAGAPAGVALFAWLRSAIAKYVPGIVWYPLTAVDRLRRSGSGAGRAALAFYVDAVGSIVAAVIVGAIALPAFAAADAPTALWLLLAVPAAVSLHPRVFSIGLRLIGRVTSSSAAAAELSWRTVAGVVGLHIGSWLFAGLALQLVLRALDAPAPWPLVFAATSLSWAAGLLAVPVPAGLGVREAALVGLLAAHVDTSTAVAAALGSRALFVAIDLLSLAVSFPAARAARATASVRTSTAPGSAP